MNKGGVFIVSGPSGSGKDTVLAELFRNKPDLLFSISSITRAMRPGEREGDKYNFISREKFEDMIKNDELLEHNIFVGNYYGTPRAYVEEQLEKGKDVILEIEIQGALKIKERFPDTLLLFLLPPDADTREARLRGRGTETEEVIAQRLERAVEESGYMEQYDYLIAHNIQPVGYMPLGSPRRPERDICPEDVADMQTPEMQEIAKAHGVHPALIALKWAHQRGEISIPFSVHNYVSNLKCVTEDPLTDEEMAKIATLEKGNRLVKGQVFLWEGAKDWHDLWDEDGVIVK